MISPPASAAALADDTPSEEAGVSRRGRSADAVHRYILDRINEGTLKPGNRVRESTLAERTGLSRTPAREAMQRLENEGLLTHAAHHGMAVRTLDHQEVTEFYLIRGLLEGTAASLAARHASDAEIDALRVMLLVQSTNDATPSKRAR